jgi:hypothetical protein
MYVMKAYEGVEIYLHIFLTSALLRVELLASRPGRYNHYVHYVRNESVWGSGDTSPHIFNLNTTKR